MNKKLQVKDLEKKAADVKRTASYRQALRKSAPPGESDDHLAKDSEDSPEPEQTAPAPQIVTSQPTTEKKVSIDEQTEPKDEQTEPMLQNKTNGDNGFKANGFAEETTAEGENVCTEYCCRRLCCDYCKCCPNCCSMQMKRLETLLIHITDCGLNCLRVFS